MHGMDMNNDILVHYIDFCFIGAFFFFFFWNSPTAKQSNEMNF